MEKHFVLLHEDWTSMEGSGFHKETGKVKREGLPKNDCFFFSKPVVWLIKEVGWNRAARRLIWIKGNLRHN